MEFTDVFKHGAATAAVLSTTKTPKLSDIEVKKDGDKTDNEMESLLGSKDKVKEFIPPFESTLTVEELEKLGLKKDAAGQLVAMDAVTAGKMRDVNAEIDNGIEQYRDTINAIANSDANDTSNIQGSEKHNSIGGNSYTLSNGNLAVTSNDSISAKYFQDLADKALNDKGSLYRNTTGKVTGSAAWQQMTKSDLGKSFTMPLLASIVSGGTFPIVGVFGMWQANRDKLEQATNLVNDMQGGTFDNTKPYGYRSGQQVFNFMLGWQNLDGELKKRGTNLKDFVRWGHSQGFVTNQVLANINKYNPEYFEKVNTINARAELGEKQRKIEEADGIMGVGDTTFVDKGTGEPVGLGQSIHGEAVAVTSTKPEPTIRVPHDITSVTKPEPTVTKPEPTVTKPEPERDRGGGQPISGPHESSGGGSSVYTKPSPTRRGPHAGGYQAGGPLGNPMGQQQEQQQPLQDAGNLELVQEQGKDQTGVADDVKRQLNEGDFVINAPAREMAGHSDIERMITKAITELQRKGVKLDFGQTAEDPDSIVQALVSNKELIIPKVIAQQIGYDRLEKINNRGKQRVDEIEKEQQQQQDKGFIQGQPPTQRVEPQQGVQMGGQITLEENKNQPIAIPRESFAGMSSVGKRLLSPLAPEQQDREKELLELAKPSQSFEGFLKPIKMAGGDIVQQNISRADRNNNPFNLASNDKTDIFYGSIGRDIENLSKEMPKNGFLKFDTLDNGLRAGAYVLRNQYNNMNADEIANRWSKTDKVFYAQAIKNKFGNNKINTQDDKTLLELLKIMTNQEGTKQVFSEDQLRNAIKESNKEKENATWAKPIIKPIIKEKPDTRINVIPKPKPQQTGMMAVN
jgi:hypothetical protein